MGNKLSIFKIIHNYLLFKLWVSGNYGNYQIYAHIITVITKVFKIITVITIYNMNIIKKSIGFILKKVHNLDKYFLENNTENINKKQEKNVIKNLDYPDLKKNQFIEKEFINKNNNELLNYKSEIDNIQKNEKENNSFNNLNKHEISEQDQILKNTYTKSEITKLENTKIYDVQKIDYNKINTIWDVIKIKENTQAEHIIKSLSSDQWMDIEEIKKRIKLEFNIEYQNEKSLYPYIKTLTDINLIKVNNTGKKRTWKKNIILIENNK